jgi:hypothetical protein
MALSPDEIYAHFKKGPVKLDEEFHSKLLIKVMSDKSSGTMASFCVKAMISESTFYNWLRDNQLFFDIYAFCKMLAKYNWEQEGNELRDLVLPPGATSYAYEHWKLKGWSQFGISKNSRIKLNLDPNGNPNQHYAQLLKQASEGEFTASEIKQLMEAVNVGLNTHQVFELQKEIDQLRSDLATMQANSDGNNTFTNKGIA